VLLALDHRHGVSAAEPAVQVDVGAALGAERPQRVHGGLAADRAGFRRGGLGGDERDLGAGWGERPRKPKGAGCWDGVRMLGLARARPKRTQPYSSTRIRASVMIGPHFFISALRWRASSSGVEPTGVVAMRASLSPKSGERTTVTASALILAMI